MSGDIVERLRALAKVIDAPHAVDAADEIERLRAERDAIDALHQPVSNPYDSEPNSLCGHCLHQWPCQTHRLLHSEAATHDR